MGIGELSGKPDEMLGVTLQWTSIPSRGSSDTPNCFSYGNWVDCYLSQVQTLPFTLKWACMCFDFSGDHGGFIALTS